MEDDTEDEDTISMEKNSVMKEVKAVSFHLEANVLRYGAVAVYKGMKVDLIVKIKILESSKFSGNPSDCGQFKQ